MGCWIPIVQGFAELFVYIQSVTSFLAPPICAVYVLAVLWDRLNEVVSVHTVTHFRQIYSFCTQTCFPSCLTSNVCANVSQAAFWSLMLGLVIGMIRFIWETSYGQVCI